MNEPIGESQQGPGAPRPNRRRSGSRRRGGQRRPRENREPEREPIPGETPALVVVPESGEPLAPQPAVVAPVETPALAPHRPPQQFQQRVQQQRPPQQQQPKPHHPRIPGSPIVQAIEQVEDVIRNLKESLRELEEVLEILDDAQRQQIGDEKEIESWRRSLSVLQRARDSVRREPPREREQPRENFRSPPPEEQRPPVEPMGE